MKKKLALEELKLSSFVTTDNHAADVKVGGLELQNTVDFMQCTTTTWYSELNTACTCPPTWHCSNDPLICEH